MTASSAEGFFTSINKFIESAVGLIQGFINLFLSELQLARKSLVWIIALVFVAFIMFITAWLFSLATLVAVLVHFHLSWWLALLIVAGTSLLALLIIIFVMMRLSRNLTLPATRRQLHLFRGEGHHDHNESTTAKN